MLESNKYLFRKISKYKKNRKKLNLFRSYYFYKILAIFLKKISFINKKWNNLQDYKRWVKLFKGISNLNKNKKMYLKIYELSNQNANTNNKAKNA